MASIDINISDPFINGDFNLFNADAQNVQAIIIAQPGQFYQFPTFGVGIRDQINAPVEAQFLKADISGELSKDFYVLTEYETTYDGNQILIELDTERIRP